MSNITPPLVLLRRLELIQLRGALTLRDSEEIEEICLNFRDLAAAWTKMECSLEGAKSILGSLNGGTPDQDTELSELYRAILEAIPDYTKPKHEPHHLDARKAKNEFQ